jgi:hypothetical protein
MPPGQESVMVTVTGRREQALLLVHLIFTFARQYIKLSLLQKKKCVRVKEDSTGDKEMLTW